MRPAILVVFAFLLLCPPVASAQSAGLLESIRFVDPLPAPAAGGTPFLGASWLAVNAQTPAPAPVAVDYSDGYRVRARIHKYASLATLPLFATEVALGQSAYGSPSDGKRQAHIAVGTAIGGLFAVNTVTGAWNLWAGRADSHGRKRRLAHGLLMMAANAGFVATAAVAPHRLSLDYASQRQTHRAIALTSVGLATAGYLTMLLGGR
jgi:hypothetical protein